MFEKAMQGFVRYVSAPIILINALKSDIAINRNYLILYDGVKIENVDLQSYPHSAVNLIVVSLNLKLSMAKYN